MYGSDRRERNVKVLSNMMVDLAIVDVDPEEVWRYRTGILSGSEEILEE